MKKTLVVFAHPHFEYSHANAELIKAYGDFPEVDFKDLYEEYPDFHIASFRERKRIRDYERLVFHFPLIWFTSPPLLKLWIDEVFDLKWLSEDQNPLKNKDAVIIVTMGGKEENYSEMSTQELIEIIGYVKEENQQSFLKELNSRIPKMSEYEKAQYEKRLSGDITQEEQIEDEK